MTRSPGLSRTPGTGGTEGAPRTDGTQGSTRGTIFHWFGGHAPTIPKCEYHSGGKFIAVCRGIPISIDANSAEVNRNMVDHLNLTAEAQDVQTHVLTKLVENTRQREFDKLFNAIPIYDGEDPDKFEPWLTQLENACIVGKRDVREVAICSCAGPVLEVISSIDPTEPWSVHRDELRRCFSPNKTRVHAANLLNNFRPQHATENLRSYIHQYSKIHRQATGLQPEDDFDLGRKVEFMKRLRNSAIANKIIKSQQFKEYTRYSLQSCFAKALELEGEFMVGEVVTPRYRQTSILGVEASDPAEGEGAYEVKHQTDQGKGDLYNPNECWRCGGMGHFARECTQDANPT